LDSISVNKLDFKRVPQGSSFLGSDKGGWIYASQRPRYEVQLPDYYILEHPITRGEVAGLLGENEDVEDSEEPMIGLIESEIEAIRKQIGEQLDISGLPGKWEVRSPSFPEWHHARNEIHLDSGVVEILGDAAAANHRGAMMDGRVRPIETTGPLQYHRLAVEMHPKRKDVFATSNIPVDRSLTNTVVRFVVSPVREAPARRVPKTADSWGNFRTEMLWTTLLGIVPSFLIPILRGFDTYALDGWPNLLFGGLVAGFVTGAIWRPRRPTISFEEGVIQESEDSLASVSQ
jgi:hypothetical protein